MASAGLGLLFSLVGLLFDTRKTPALVGVATIAAMVLFFVLKL